MNNDVILLTDITYFMVSMLFYQVISLVDQFRSATGPNKISLPTNDSDLDEK